MKTKYVVFTKNTPKYSTDTPIDATWICEAHIEVIYIQLNVQGLFLYVHCSV